MQVIPSIYTGPGLQGDFAYMIQNPRYKKDIFIFNDNTVDHYTDKPGGGNAIIRPYNAYGSYSSYPRSAGIPTGHSRLTGGYKSLTKQARREILTAVAEIEEITEKHNYNRLFFSARPLTYSGERPMISTGIFQIGYDVREFITDLIYSLEIDKRSC